jgi:uncharacterized membrane protein YdbT with pleckstrin-like domain
MTYVARTLAPGETIRATAHLHWLIWLRAWGALALLGVFVIGIVYFIGEWIRIASTEIALTDRRLILKRGWLDRHTEELELSSVESINLDQSYWGRLFNFGRLSVHGTGDDAWLSPMVASPLEFRRALEAALSASRAPEPARLAS